MIVGRERRGSGRSAAATSDQTPPPTPIGGENYGWNIWEGNNCFAGPCGNPSAFVFPVYTYTHSSGCSITGGFVYRGCAMPNIRGKYFFSDFCSAFIRSFQWNGATGATNVTDWASDLNNQNAGISINNVSSFGEDARGELYIVDINGEVFKVVAGTP